FLKCSGSLKCRGDVIAQNGITISGSSTIGRNLSSRKSIETSGRFTTGGNVEGENLFLGYKHGILAKKIFKNRRRSIVNGSVLALNNVQINHIYVRGNVMGSNVVIGSNSIIDGVIYYVENLTIEKGAQCYYKPVKINADDLINKNKNKNELNKNTIESEPIDPSKTSQRNFCPSCGEKLERDSSNYCSQCGSELQ
ncbi:MAG: zinc ribbon domain-containing protein, partial [archaeon]|nr:zinc ribbon domain-containing protein [archaeon]